jgi:thioredoxin-related protein
MKFCILILGLIFSIFSYSQQLNWVKFSDLNDSLKANPKKVIIKIGTDWCGYCKMMDFKVFNTKKSLKKIGSQYYFVRLNAEVTEAIVFRNKEYQASTFKRGKHELAIELNGIENELVYPTTILLSSNLEIEKRVTGYLKRTHFFLWLSK